MDFGLVYVIGAVAVFAIMLAGVLCGVTAARQRRRDGLDTPDRLQRFIHAVLLSTAAALFWPVVVPVVIVGGAVALCRAGAP